MSLDTGQGPTFDSWGIALEPVAGAPRVGRLGGRRPRLGRRSSWLNLAIVGVTTAVMAALIVHFATAGSALAGTGASAASTRALAGVVNLRLSDLPGFRVGRDGGGATATGDPAAVFGQCFGTVYGTAGEESPAVDSPAFVVGGGLQTAAIGSSVSLASDSQLASDTALAGNPLFPRCFAQALASVTWSAPGVSVSGADPTATTLPPPVAATGTVNPILGMRASMAWTAASITIPVTVDVYVVTVGHAEITLYAFAAGAPYSTSHEQQLVSLLVHRALAAGR